MKGRLSAGLRGVVIGFAIVDLFVAALGLFLGKTMLLVGVTGMVAGEALGLAIMWFLVAPRLRSEL